MLCRRPPNCLLACLPGLLYVRNAPQIPTRESPGIHKAGADLRKWREKCVEGILLGTAAARTLLDEEVGTSGEGGAGKEACARSPRMGWNHVARMGILAHMSKDRGRKGSKRCQLSCCDSINIRSNYAAFHFPLSQLPSSDIQTDDQSVRHLRPGIPNRLSVPTSRNAL